MIRVVEAWGKWMWELMRIRGVRGEGVEFVEFYETNRNACLRAVRATVGDRQLAEDLVAEAFTRAWMSWPKVRHTKATRPRY